MRVILREDIQKLGEAGEVVTVKRGYARNYLIPNKLAMEATEGNLKTFKDIDRARESRSEKERGEAEVTAQKLAAVRVLIPVEVSADGHLYGSVTNQMIRDALAEVGIEIERRFIQLASPIKDLGTFDVPIRLHRDVEPTIQVVVEGTDGETGAVDWEAAVEVEEAKEAKEAEADAAEEMPVESADVDGVDEVDLTADVPGADGTEGEDAAVEEEE